MISTRDSLYMAGLWGAALLFFRIFAWKLFRPKNFPFNQSIYFLFFLSILTYIFWIWGSLGTLAAPLVTLLTCFTLATLTVGVIPALPHANISFSRTGEILFWIVFSLSILLRLYSPKLDIGEKYADLMILQGCLSDLHFPPLDRWLAGHTLNYYYYGQLFFAPLGRTLPIPPEVLFHLITATVAACFADTTYSVLRFFKAKKWIALLAASCVIVFGNWHWIEIYVHHTRDIFWWWDSSRAIENTITEFPFFSLLLGDLHAHFIGLPFLNLSVAVVLILQAYLNGGSQNIIRAIALTLTCAIVIGQNYPMNAWQLPPLALLAALILRRHFKILCVLGLASLLLFLPFWLQYEKPTTVSGLFYIARDMRSPLWHFSLHWGFFIFSAFLITFKSIRKFNLRHFFILALIATIVSAVISFPGGCLTLLLGMAFLFYKEELSFEAWMLFALSLFCILFVELFSIDKTYGGKYLRLNTVFKFYMIAWWGLSLTIPQLIEKSKLRFWIWVPVFAASLVYPVLGTKSRVGEKIDIPTLDGMGAWNKEFQNERDIITWLRKNTSPNDVIMETAGGGYEKFARISTFSGRVSVVGWLNHQQVWRNNGYQMAMERMDAIKNLSQAFSPQGFTDFIKKYNVKWVMIGDLEYQNWSPALINHIKTLPAAIKNGSSGLYSTRSIL